MFMGMVLTVRMAMFTAMMMLMSGAHIAPAIERVDEAHVVETAQVVQVPQGQRIYLARIAILADGFFVDIRDRLHLGIKPRLEDAGEALVRDGRLFEIHPAVLGGARADDLDRFLRPRLEEVDAFDHSLEEALHDVGMLFDKAE